jgi:AmiR/NasT family two-component response regulator
LEYTNSPPPAAVEQDESRAPVARRIPIHQAVLLIQDRHDVGEMDAYAMLVHASVDTRSSVRDMAARVVEGSA